MSLETDVGTYQHGGTHSQGLGDHSGRGWVEEDRRACKMSPGAKVQENGDPAKEAEGGCQGQRAGPGQENSPMESRSSPCPSCVLSAGFSLCSPALLGSLPHPQGATSHVQHQLQVSSGTWQTVCCAPQLRTGPQGGRGSRSGAAGSCALSGTRPGSATAPTVRVRTPWDPDLQTTHSATRC